MTYQRKTEDEYQIHGYYNGHREEVHCEGSFKEARETLKTFRENEPGIRFVILKKRVPKALNHAGRNAWI